MIIVSPHTYVKAMCNPHVVNKPSYIVIAVVMTITKGHWAPPENVLVIVSIDEVRVDNSNALAFAVYFKGRCWNSRHFLFIFIIHSSSLDVL